MSDEPTDRPHPAPGARKFGPHGAAWSVWAPKAQRMMLAFWEADDWRGAPRELHAMRRDELGYFSFEREQAAQGRRYAYVFPDGAQLPDPAALWQPDGVHEPSALYFPEDFAWTDHDWRGIERRDLAIYELHVGTFTPEGTFDAVIPRLSELQELGITAIELLPIAQFPGGRNWGYDGVHLFAAQNTYGGPAALQRLVDAAHAHGLAVWLDVVYNHLGPEGNYLGKFGPYFTDRYHTPWGDALNFDGPDSDGVRNFVLTNAESWVRDFHIDGLRLDAVHAIFDMEAWHILAELQHRVQQIAQKAGRQVHVVAESNQNDPRLVEPLDKRGFGLDGVWADDFHHAVHAVLTGEVDGYYCDFGEAKQLAKAMNDVFVYDGRYSKYRKRRHGAKVGDSTREPFVVSVQNHDQIGNRMLGDRFGTLLSPDRRRMACGLLLTAPFTPMLFMGEEYAETRPFPFFCSFLDPGLIQAVRDGRRREFAHGKFQWEGEPPDPQAESTFASSVLSWQWPEGSQEAGLRRLYQTLLAARKNQPGLNDRRWAKAELFGGRDVKDRAPVLVVRRGERAEAIVAANLSSEPQALADRDREAFDRRGRRLWLSTEQTEFGGGGLREDGRLSAGEMQIWTVES